jgi:intracellular multiplication protein IcmP
LWYDGQCPALLERLGMGVLQHVSQQKSSNEEFILAAIVVGLVCGISYLIWTVFHREITEVLRWVRVVELYLVGIVKGNDFTYADAQMGVQNVGSWKRWLLKADNSEISTDHIRVMTMLAVPPLRFVFAGIIGMMALWVIFFGPGTQYRRRMNLETLMHEQAKSFPAIFPFLKFDPRKLPFRAPGSPVPSKLPLFAEALSPEEWLAFHEIRMVGGQIDANRAYNALVLQLGKRWQGAAKLSPHGQAIFAACALKHVRKRKDSELLLDELSKSWTPEKGLALSGKVKAQIRKVIADPKIGGALEKFADQHAYETTALLRCLARARSEGGVLPPASFLWLRGHDRNLWYPLNNLGRKSYHAEASGALVHYTNELIAGQKIPTPRFEEVIRGIEQYMKSGVARSIPELDKKASGDAYWKSKSKK